MKIVSQFGHREARKVVSRDLLKVFGFCKMLWIAKDARETAN